MTDLSQSQELPVLTDKERLEAYNLLIAGCNHLWSKNKLQSDRIQKVLETLIPVAKNDPYFLAHLVGYTIHKSKLHDLHVLTTYVNALSAADGSPFSPGSKYLKPNLRNVSAAAVQTLEPKFAKRVGEVARSRYGVKGVLNEGHHFPSFLRTSLVKYLKYRELNLEILRGIKKAGLGKQMVNFYKMMNLGPSDQAAAILRWKQRGKEIKFDKPLVDFTNLTDLQIAEKIRAEKIPALVITGALLQANKKMSPVIAVAMLEQCTGNQAVILRKTFEDAGLLDDKEVSKYYEEKIKTAKTALDRVDTITKEASESVKRIMKSARAESRKESVGSIGKVFIHLDLSPSMEPAIEVAKDRGAIIAEMVSNPATNFMWGTFNNRKEILPNPKVFERDAFKSILFGKRCDGMTDCFMLYDDARKFGADVDVFISDGCHNIGDLGERIKRYHAQTDLPKPRAMLHIRVVGNGPGYSKMQERILKDAYESNGIPVAVMEPEALTSSAGVAEAVRLAMKGPMQIVEDIMNEPLLTLPRWYFTI